MSSSGSVGATAAAVIAIPQPMAARHSARARGRDRAAEIRPPPTAPTPITEAITPYAPAPPPNTLLAISGSVT
jgi:hypothetical protein